MCNNKGCGRFFGLFTMCGHEGLSYDDRCENPTPKNNEREARKINKLCPACIQAEDLRNAREDMDKASGPPSKGKPVEDNKAERSGERKESPSGSGDRSRSRSKKRSSRNRK
jgi:hypothetical protein